MQTAEPFSSESGPHSAMDERYDEDDIFAHMNVDDLLSHLLALPAKERAELAAKLIESLHDEDSPEGSSEEIEAAWDAELARRSAELEDGTVKAIPYSEYVAIMDRKKAARAKR